MNTELWENSLEELIDDCFDLRNCYYGLLVFSFIPGKKGELIYSGNVKIEGLLKAYNILNSSDNDSRPATDTIAQ